MRILLNLFKINDKPAGEVMSDGQVEMAAAIILKINPRVASLASTGYGKSEAISMGVIYRVVFFKEDFVIGSVKLETSDIIMQRVIAHLFDDNFLLSQLELEKDQELSRLKRERRKGKLTFKRGGSVKVVSFHGADEDASQAIGEHVRNVVLDESPLLRSGKYLQVLKMLQGTGSYEDTFLFELGNALNRNHFMENVKTNPNYYKIDISLEQAIAEGRLDPRAVDEARGKPFFKEFYLCQFPEEDEIDSKGYRQLLLSNEVLFAQIEATTQSDLPMKLGVDVAAGGDYNVYCVRQGNQAWFESWNRSHDTMTNVNEVIRIIDKYTVTVKDAEGKPLKDSAGNEVKKRLLKPEEVYLDDIGIGRGVTDRLKEMSAEINGMKVNYHVNGVSVGEKPQDPSKFKNIKAENSWLAAQWVKNGGKLVKDERWQQLAWIKYKVSTDKVLQIEPKDDLKERENKSPDFFEGFMLTFSIGKPQPGITLL